MGYLYDLQFNVTILILKWDSTGSYNFINEFPWGLHFTFQDERAWKGLHTYIYKVTVQFDGDCIVKNRGNNKRQPAWLLSRILDTVHNRLLLHFMGKEGRGERRHMKEGRKVMGGRMGGIWKDGWKEGRKVIEGKVMEERKEGYRRKEGKGRR